MESVMDMRNLKQHHDCKTSSILTNTSYSNHTHLSVPLRRRDLQTLLDDPPRPEEQQKLLNLRNHQPVKTMQDIPPRDTPTEPTGELKEKEAPSGPPPSLHPSEEQEVFETLKQMKTC
ncbi:hypothetical protein OJAV_G00177400 [Oryzias javanicus]|uniref:Uncharacterized protein n=1 Tax=Oryzias javanicus TaxID=123683 RepID=A0A3S2U3R6_ORYJA|nr:hypothetical protein OJAV_G00177400 [Oryzias javanicus]